VDFVHVYFELDELLEVLWREADVDYSLLFLRPVVEVNGILVDILTLLVDDVGVQRGVVVLVLVAVFLNFGEEDVSALTRRCLPAELGVALILGDIFAVLVLGILLNMWLVVFEAEGKRLADLLGLIVVEKDDFSVGREALDAEAGLLSNKGLIS